MNKHPFITMIGTLPPLVGLSPYTRCLVEALNKIIPLDFLGFHHLYPAGFFPGKLEDPTAHCLSGSGRLRIRNVLNWFNPIGWINEAFRIRTEIIHAQWWSYPLAPVYLIILGLNKLRGKKIILTVHNVKPHEMSLLKTVLNRSVIFLADVYIVHTETSRRALRPLVGHAPIHVIPHGAIEGTGERLGRVDACEALHIDAACRYILFFGTIRDYKGLDVAIKALAMIPDTSVKLLIAGHCWEEWAKYQKLIDLFNLEHRVIARIDFVPSNQVGTYFSAADIIVLPYKHFDAQSGIVGLAVQYGVPLIVSDTGGLADKLNTPECVVVPNDHTALAENTMKILNDKNLAQQIREDERNLTLELSWKKIAERTVLEVYGRYKKP